MTRIVAAGLRETNRSAWYLNFVRSYHKRVFVSSPDADHSDIFPHCRYFLIVWVYGCRNCCCHDMVAGSSETSVSSYQNRRRHFPESGSLHCQYSVNLISPFRTDTGWRSWLRHCATSRKVAGSIPDGVIGIFLWHNPSDALWPWSWLSLEQKWVPGIFPGGLRRPVTLLSYRISRQQSFSSRPNGPSVKCNLHNIIQQTRIKCKLTGTSTLTDKLPRGIGRDSAAGIATRYGLYGPRIESR